MAAACVDCAPAQLAVSHPPFLLPHPLTPCGPLILTACFMVASGVSLGRARARRLAFVLFFSGRASRSAFVFVLGISSPILIGRRALGVCLLFLDYCGRGFLFLFFFYFIIIIFFVKIWFWIFFYCFWLFGWFWLFGLVFFIVCRSLLMSAVLSSQAVDMALAKDIIFIFSLFLLIFSLGFGICFFGIGFNYFWFFGLVFVWFSVVFHCRCLVMSAFFFFTGCGYGTCDGGHITSRKDGSD